MEPPPAVAAPDTGTSMSLSQRTNSLSQASEDSQTATEFINDQLQLEADAREALPYTFDSCTQPLGALRQILFSCLTCNPSPSSPSDPYTPAGVCYSCSIACHGDHTLVELFSKRDFVCDCGTSRFPSSSPCTLRINPQTGTKGGSHSEKPAEGNKYNQNFKNRFCGCEKAYDAFTEKGTMFQCLGMGTAQDGGCGEDWWHPECLVGLPRDWYQKDQRKEEVTKTENVAPPATSAPNGSAESAPPTRGDQDLPTETQDNDPPTPPGFPHEDDFEAFLCYKCVEAFPWIKRYAGTKGFLPPVFKDTSHKPSAESIQTGDTAVSEHSEPSTIDVVSRKRKAEENGDDERDASRVKADHDDPPISIPLETPSNATTSTCLHQQLPPTSSSTLSLFLKEDFRDHFCRCPSCFPLLSTHPHLLEEEESYQPPRSETDDDGPGGGSSIGTGSLLDRGERALNNVDRVRAIEGVMVYNHLKEKVKSFLKPFAENGQAVGAEDIKAYFEQLRGDAEAVKAAGAAAGGGGGEDEGEGSTRREQSGY